MLVVHLEAKEKTKWGIGCYNHRVYSIPDIEEVLADVALAVERILGKDEVVGSNPAISTKVVKDQV